MYSVVEGIGEEEDGVREGAVSCNGNGHSSKGTRTFEVVPVVSCKQDLPVTASRTSMPLIAG